MKTRTAAALIRQGRNADARALSPEVIPVRSPSATSAQLDLSSFYTRAPSDFHFAELQPGLHEFDGVVFDIRGSVILAGMSHLHRGATDPNTARGITVGDTVTSVHVLQATIYETSEGTRVGRYVLRYADGESRELPIRYCEDTRNHWSGLDVAFDRGIEAKNGKTVWQGKDRFAQSGGATIRLFKRTYANPRPTVRLESIDFETTMTACSPILLGISVEK
jgi:hypothetical protein